MNEAIERANKVIAALSASSSANVADLAPADINEVVERALALVAGEISDRSITLKKVLAPALPECRVDPDDITRVLVNVLLNACQAMPHGGGLKVSTATGRVKAGEVAFVAGDRSGAGVRVCGDVVQVSVEDSGHGVPADKMDMVFDPFFTTQPAGKGIGLGLTVSQKIMERHGGRITLANVAGGGARAELIFHAEEPVPAATA